MLPKISVIIPSFNKQKYVARTLDSIFDQKYENLEIIIQDGGSTDKTLTIIKSYIKKYPGKIVFESKKDNGQLDAVNKGMKKSSGEILTFINADDYYSKNAFKEVAVEFNNNPDNLWIVGRGRVVDERNKEIAKPVSIYKNFLLSHFSYNYLLTTNFIIQPSVFFTKKAYKKFGPFTGTDKFIMEYEFWLNLAKQKMPIILNKNISNFRIEKNTKTKTMFSDILHEDQKIVKKHTNNFLILALHHIHNIARVIIGRFV